MDSGAGTGVLHQDLGGKKRADLGFYRKEYGGHAGNKTGFVWK